jgi:hypothetical protein
MMRRELGAEPGGAEKRAAAAAAYFFSTASSGGGIRIIAMKILVHYWLTAEYNCLLGINNKLSL